MERTEETLVYRVVRSSRKTIAIQITPAGEVLVRVPRGLGNESIRVFVEKKLPWIRKHLPSPTTEAEPKLTEQQLRALAEKAREDFAARVTRFGPLVGVSWGRITIRTQKTRWGSCSGKGNLNFNCLLMLSPEPVRDYVVVHELCHRLEMNHSPAFWQQVERIFPDYRVHQQWLKDHGNGLIAKL